MSPFDHPVALTLFGFAVLSVAFIIYEVRHAPLRPSEPSSWDVLDGVGQPRCWSTGPRGGHAYRYVNGVWVCRCCGDLRNPNPDRDLTHTEAREVHDDARHIPGEAAGGGGV
jgi:hypothetical protein